MNEQKTLELVNQIIGSIFHQKNPMSLEEIYQKYAFDAKLPYCVKDSVTQTETWADSVNGYLFITPENSLKWDQEKGWMREKKTIRSFDDLLKYWQEINYVLTERVYDCVNVSKSDTIYRCQNVYHSTNCTDSKNVVFCNGSSECESILACSRSFRCTFCMRTDDSTSCSNSYNVICSDKISNSFFIQDCANLDHCMFCAHISNQRYCIANMQFLPSEYEKIEEAILAWILNS